MCVDADQPSTPSPDQILKMYEAWNSCPCAYGCERCCEPDAAAFYVPVLLARLAAVEELDADDLGHGLFCASHYERRPCDCWAKALDVALGREAS